MGEIADMMLDGTLDQYTGKYIYGKSPGYPRSHKRNNPDIANRNAKKGVKMYLNKKGIPKSKHYEYVEAFVIKHSKSPTNYIGWNGKANYIQENWSEFIKFINLKNYGNN